MGDRERWNEKYRGRLGRTVQPPDPFVLRMLARADLDQRGRALDLAAGTGRHSCELARRGWQTHACDVSEVGLELLRGRAETLGVEVATHVLDLLAGEWPAMGVFDLILAVDFLDRDLFAGLGRSLSPGGHLLLRTFTVDWPGTRPPAAFRLERGEWSQALPGFEPLVFEEAQGRAGLLARRRGG